MKMMNEGANTESIIKAFKESEIKDISKIIEFVEKFVKEKKEESNKLLSFIEADQFEFNECINIISKFTYISLCRRIGELNTFVEVDKEHENETPAVRSSLQPVTKKPWFFESDIFKASEKGKLTSIQYLVENEHCIVEGKDKEGRTPLYIASENGNFDIVKYLIEECHCNIEAQNNDGRTPLYIALENGNFDIVKYLIEDCHADIKTICPNALNIAVSKENFKLVKYLIEECHNQMKLTCKEISSL